jgi:hypothetical protein
MNKWHSSAIIALKGKKNANALQIGLPNFLGIKTTVHKMILPNIFD